MAKTRVIEVLRCALVSGSVASVLSTVALAVCGKLEGRPAAGPVNGPSQWLWGRQAAHARETSLRHTLVGYLVHHVASLGWSVVYETWRRQTPNERRAGAFCQAGVVAALASAVDYNLTPKRLRPGFEVQLSKPSLFAAYTAFAIGLALCARAERRAVARSAEALPMSSGQRRADAAPAARRRLGKRSTRDGRRSAPSTSAK